MIKDIPGFVSHNSLISLPDGTYEVSETTYTSATSPTSATFCALANFGAGEILACDLIVVLEDGSVLFRDFLQLEDGRWRDSNGMIDHQLSDLLPPELSAFRQDGSTVISQVSIENGVVQRID